MSFRLTNIPSTFMILMNHILCNFIGRFIVVYFNNILIYSKSLNEHVEYLNNVINVLREECSYANLKWCNF